MKTTLRVLLVAVALLFLGTTSANAHGFLKIGDIKGESTDEGHEEWIDVLSIDWGFQREQGRSGSSRAPGRLVFRDLTIHKESDSTSPSIMLKCAKGERIPEVTLDLPLENDRGESKIRVILMNAMITSVQVEDEAGGDRPTENISINYTEIKVIYDGVLGMSEFGWDLRGGRGL